jgi:hypothetical protein
MGDGNIAHCNGTSSSSSGSLLRTNELHVTESSVRSWSRIYPLNMELNTSLSYSQEAATSSLRKGNL